MSPIEKANELVGRYELVCCYEEVKNCALICVDEIIKEIPMYTGCLNDKWVYWQQVKQEIEKL